MKNLVMCSKSLRFLLLTEKTKLCGEKLRLFDKNIHNNNPSSTRYFIETIKNMNVVQVSCPVIKLESQHDPFIVFVVQLISFLVNLVQKKRGGVNVSSRRRPLMIDDGATSEYPAPAVKIARPSANTDFNTSYVDLVCTS